MRTNSCLNFYFIFIKKSHFVSLHQIFSVIVKMYIDELLFPTNHFIQINVFSKNKATCVNINLDDQYQVELDNAVFDQAYFDQAKIEFEGNRVKR